MNEENQNKGILIVVIIIIIISLLFIIPIILVIIGMVILPKMISSMGEKVGMANHSVGELRIYIPSKWKQNDEYIMSTSGNCKVIGGTTLFEQDRVERIYLKKELEHHQVEINGIDVSYGFENTGEKEYYSYYIEYNNDKYTIMFVNNVDSDEECNSYIDKLEQSLTIKEELEGKNIWKKH